MRLSLSVTVPLLGMALYGDAAPNNPINSKTGLYRYFSDGVEFKTADATAPIELNGMPIGTRELSPIAANGTVHALSDGHHFQQKDWFLTGVNGGSWEYLPELRSSYVMEGRRPSDKLRKRADKITFRPTFFDDKDLKSAFETVDVGLDPGQAKAKFLSRDYGSMSWTTSIHEPQHASILLDFGKMSSNPPGAFEQIGPSTTVLDGSIKNLNGENNAIFVFNTSK